MNRKILSSFQLIKKISISLHCLGLYNEPIQSKQPQTGNKAMILAILSLCSVAGYIVSRPVVKAIGV